MNNFITSILNGYDTLFKVLLIFIFLDYLTGVLRAIYNEKLNSKIGAKGIIKKIGYVILVIVTTMLDNLVSADGYIRNMIIYMFIANEGISILENWSEMGIPLPKIIKDKFTNMKGGE